MSVPIKPSSSAVADRAVDRDTGVVGAKADAEARKATIRAVVFMVELVNAFCDKQDLRAGIPSRNLGNENGLVLSRKVRFRQRQEFLAGN